jgi:2-phosphosulfolactate phosphatase
VSQTGLTTDDVAQHGFAYRFGWGQAGLQTLAPRCDVIVIVDVLRFSTAVSVAVDRAAVVYPYRWRDASASVRADELRAELAGRREDGGWSLSPTDLQRIEPGTRILLPSPNGSTLTLAASEAGVAHVLAGCLRNASATARIALQLAHGSPIGVIAAGEHWPDDRGLRPAVEDLLGAGAILAGLDPSAATTPPHGSPEARTAAAAFTAERPLLSTAIADGASGRELIRLGFADDVDAAAQLDVSSVAALLTDGAFRRC